MINRLKKTLGIVKKTPTLPPEDRPAPEQSATPPVVDVTDTDFAAVVEQSERLAVVDFWADWCEPCHTMSAFVGFLATDFADDLLVAALDVDENPETPARFNVMGLPTLLFLRNGEEVDRHVGVAPYAVLRAKVDGLLRNG